MRWLSLVLHFLTSHCCVSQIHNRENNLLVSTAADARAVCTIGGNVATMDICVILKPLGAGWVSGSPLVSGSSFGRVCSRTMDRQHHGLSSHRNGQRWRILRQDKFSVHSFEIWFKQLHIYFYYGGGVGSHWLVNGLKYCNWDGSVKSLVSSV